MIINLENKYGINLMNVEMWEYLSDERVAVHFRSGSTIVFGDPSASRGSDNPDQCKNGKELKGILESLSRPQAVLPPNAMSMIRPN